MLSRANQAQSPKVLGPGGGPRSGGPDHTSIRPHDRSTRTVIEERTRPVGERVSMVQGSAGSTALIGSSYPPGATTSTTEPFTTSVTAMVVPLAMLSVVGASVAGGSLGLPPNRHQDQPEHWTSADHLPPTSLSYDRKHLLSQGPTKSRMS